MLPLFVHHSNTRKTFKLWSFMSWCSQQRYCIILLLYDRVDTTITQPTHSVVPHFVITRKLFFITFRTKFQTLLFSHHVISPPISCHIPCNPFLLFALSMLSRYPLCQWRSSLPLLYRPFTLQHTYTPPTQINPWLSFAEAIAIFLKVNTSIRHNLKNILSNKTFSIT